MASRVTKITVRPLSTSLQKQSLQMVEAVLASKAEKVSSRRSKGALLYSALANATRALWPPESVVPFSPTSVWSPLGSSSKSMLRSTLL